MPRNLFITGMPKAGKTTLLHKLIWQLKKEGKKIGGFISPEEKTHGTRTGFYVMDIESGKIGNLADLHADGPMISKYHVDIQSFEDIALGSLKKADKYDVFIIDEIGWMELKSRKFSQMLDDLLESDLLIVASLHEDLVDKYAAAGEVFEVRKSNREAGYNELLAKVREALSEKPKPQEKEISVKGKKIQAQQLKKEIRPQKKQAKHKAGQKVKIEPRYVEEKSKKKGLVDRITDLFRL